ncbi:MAG: hypothetical protein OXG34_11800 [bacterium]|nr:hypothetical protein [bacterium]MCY3890155.1 hypothetical protein [bacterium]MCY3962327.1 hypothetical protein [bacterium]MCY4135565.1 hypothetical protein [bacterium]
MLLLTACTPTQYLVAGSKLSNTTDVDVALFDVCGLPATASWIFAI